MVTDNKIAEEGLSRRHLLATSGAGLAALAAEKVSAATSQAQQLAQSSKVSGPPFDTFRDFIAALEARGLLLRFESIDQDAYEGTAIMYRLIDEYGIFGAPTVLFENVKIGGEWRKGPIIGNDHGHWDVESILFGLEPHPTKPIESFRAARQHCMDMITNAGGAYPTIEPVEVARDQALCKEITLTGDEIDLTKFAFFQNNPTDNGRYINTGSVFTDDPEMGKNFGTYRCQIKGPRRIGVNSEPNQTGWKMFMAAKERGEKTVRISIVLGQDPVVWMISGSRVAGRRDGAPVDELAIAGGIRGKAVEVVKSELSDLMIPANSEMVLEGEVQLEGLLPEAPYGEMAGYMGAPKAQNFWMDVDVVTHRKDPWIANSFTGVNRGAVKAPGDALAFLTWKRFLPEMTDIHTRNDATGVTFISINKTADGQGLRVGKMVAERNPIAKIVIVVDDDLDVTDNTQMMFALGTRWQPDPASHIYDRIRGLPLDPSLPERPFTSKIVIDATRQRPGEGGPKVFPSMNRTLLEEGAPGAFDQVDAKYSDKIKSLRGRYF